MGPSPRIALDTAANLFGYTAERHPHLYDAGWIHPWLNSLRNSTYANSERTRVQMAQVLRIMGGDRIMNNSGGGAPNCEPRLNVEY